MPGMYRHVRPNARFWPFSAGRFFGGYWSMPDWLVDGNEYGWSRGVQLRKQDFGWVTFAGIHPSRLARVSG